MSIELDERGRAMENEYFRQREQELIQKMKSKLTSETSNQTEIGCPKCDGRLVETDYENIKMDVCNGCHGVWLDAGELAQIVNKEENNGGWFERVFK